MKLTRVLEPEVMDTAQEAVDYDTMDHGAVNLRFVDDLLAFANLEGDVLDMGCGTGQLPVLLCEKHSPVRVMAIDLATQMLEVARYNVEAASLTERIQLARVDAKQTDFGDDYFDAVISNSIIHHIPDPLSVLRETIRVAKPEGVIFFRDLMRPDDQETLERLVDQYAGQESDHAQQMFRDSLHAALSLEEIRNLVISLGFEADAIEASSDRHWTWAARNLVDRE